MKRLKLGDLIPLPGNRYGRLGLHHIGKHTKESVDVCVTITSPPEWGCAANAARLRSVAIASLLGNRTIRPGDRYRVVITKIEDEPDKA